MFGVSPLVRMEKDRGYAWVILGASTILMCIGPSTIYTFGFLVSGLSMRPEYQFWILNILYGFWQVAALLAAVFAKSRPRQLATIGSALAAIGFLISATTVNDTSWLYFTFSLFIGFGLGLSFHTAYLVVMSNFDAYKGLANGICQLSIAIGQITSPFLFTIVSLPRDRFQIKALTTAVGFLTTLFFVIPQEHNAASRRASYASDRRRHSYSSSSSRRGSRGEAVPLQASFLQPPSSGRVPSSHIVSQGGVRTRRRSQYLLAVSNSLLPNIPEEPECSASMNDTLTSASSESEIRSSGQALTSESVTVVSHEPTRPPSPPPASIDKQPKLPELPESIAESNETETSDDKREGDEDDTSKEEEQPMIVVCQPPPMRRKSEGNLPTFVGSLTDYKLGNGAVGGKPSPPPPPVSGGRPIISRRHSESQLQSAKTAADSSNSRRNNDPQVVDVQNPLEAAAGREGKSEKKTRGESIIDLSLLQDVYFLNMAVFSAVATVTVVNFPVVLYAYMSSPRVCGVGCRSTEPKVALLIIYIVDLISRLFISYVSDYRVLERRTAFLVGCAFSGIVISVTSLTDDILFLYCICIVYGLCVGMVVTSEYVMFIDAYGDKKFPQVYVLLNSFKLITTAVLALLVINPLSSFFYPIHPLDQQSSSRNISAYDRLEIFDNPAPGSDDGSTTSFTRLFLYIAVPSLLCAVAWITEDIYRASQRHSSHQKASSAHSSTDDVP